MAKFKANINLVILSAVSYTELTYFEPNCPYSYFRLLNSFWGKNKYEYQSQQKQVFRLFENDLSKAKQHEGSGMYRSWK